MSRTIHPSGRVGSIAARLAWMVQSNVPILGEGGRSLESKSHTRKWRAVIVALLIVAVAAIAVPSVGWGGGRNLQRDAESTISPQVGKASQDGGDHLREPPGRARFRYLNVFFKANDSSGRVWVHHSDMDLTHLGQGWLTAPVPDTAVTGPIMIRNSSGCEFGLSKPFRVIDGK